jgi:hypothetical protein
MRILPATACGVEPEADDTAPWMCPPIIAVDASALVL